MRNLLCSILAGGLILLAGCSQSPTQVDGFNVRRASGEVGVLSPDARARYRTALEHASQQEYTKAEKALLQLSKEVPTHPGVWLNLASLYYQSDRLEEAQSALARADALEPSSAAIHNLRGALAVRSGDITTAERHYHQALQQDNSAAEVYYNLGLLHDIYYQDIAAAIGYYEQYLQLNPNRDSQTEQWVEQLKLSLENQ